MTTRTTTRSGRYYTWRGQNYWSVTTILAGALPKPALVAWAANMTASYALDHIDQIAALAERDRDGAYELLKRAPWRERDRAADLGSSLHEAIESYTLGRPAPEWPLPIRPRMAAFAEFLADYQPVYELAEATVIHHRERYAGTLDAIVTFPSPLRSTLGGRTYLMDVKSGKGVYPEVALQLAAYRYAECVAAADGSEQPLPAVDACAVLHLTDGGYQLIEVVADETVYQYFLYAREIFRWQEEISKTVLLPAMAPARLEEVAS